jgi:hypothetical protein
MAQGHVGNTGSAHASFYDAVYLGPKPGRTILSNEAGSGIAGRARQIAAEGAGFTPPAPGGAGFIGPLTQAQRYASLVNSNRPWSWADDFGSPMTRAQRGAIRQQAIDERLIPEVPFKPGTRFPDFEGAGLVQHGDDLPQNLWLASDAQQFSWLDARLPNGRPIGTTWHHSDLPGRMELVPFGPHNILNHLGGRSPGLWAHAPR